MTHRGQYLSDRGDQSEFPLANNQIKCMDKRIMLSVNKQGVGGLMIGVWTAAVYLAYYCEFLLYTKVF